MNKVKCLICNDVIESKHRHDYVSCSCGNVSVDGGEDYKRRRFKDKSKFVEIETEVEELN